MILQETLYTFILIKMTKVNVRESWKIQQSNPMHLPHALNTHTPLTQVKGKKWDSAHTHLSKKYTSIASQLATWATGRPWLFCRPECREASAWVRNWLAMEVYFLDRCVYVLSHFFPFSCVSGECGYWGHGAGDCFVEFSNFLLHSRLSF